MPVQTKKGISTAKAATIVMDAKDDEHRKVEAKGMIALSKLVRESKIMVKRCIMAIHDPDVASFFNIPATDNRRYAMVEVCGSNDKKVNNIDLNVKMLKLKLSANKYKVVAEKVFKNSEYPSAKIIVKL